MREDRRAIREIGREERKLRRTSSAKTLDYASTLLEPSIPAPEPVKNVSILREKRRRVRQQKRLDRELRRNVEQQQAPGKEPSPEQVQKEALRLAREKKRLAREEERDIKEGVKPVSKQQLTEMIQKEKNKKNKKEKQPAVVENNNVSQSTSSPNGSSASVVIKLKL